MIMNVRKFLTEGEGDCVLDASIKGREDGHLGHGHSLGLGRRSGMRQTRISPAVVGCHSFGSVALWSSVKQTLQSPEVRRDPDTKAAMR